MVFLQSIATQEKNIETVKIVGEGREMKAFAHVVYPYPYQEYW